MGKRGLVTKTEETLDEILGLVDIEKEYWTGHGHLCFGEYSNRKPGWHCRVLIKSRKLMGCLACKEYCERKGK